MTFVTYEHVSELETNPQGEYFREFLSWADEYVFFFPVWWFDSPAILKNFFDVSFISGFGFKYVGHKGIGLLTNKVAKVYTTADGPSWAYYFGIVPLISSWKWRLTYCGIKVKKTFVLGEKRWQSNEHCEKWMQQHIDKVVAI
jgi:NAD(P)H dehydrogenase (quinone)